MDFELQAQSMVKSQDQPTLVHCRLYRLSPFVFILLDNEDTVEFKFRSDVVASRYMVIFAFVIFVSQGEPGMHRNYN